MDGEALPTMLFNSFEFALFFPIVTVVYFILPHRFRWAWLLAASCGFYMFFKPIYILILLFTIVIDYYAALWIASTPEKKTRQALLIASLAANLGILMVFKYYDFFASTVNYYLGYTGQSEGWPLLDILLPIGLSFHTFQAMSYTIEVYRGHQQPERHFGLYALYVMFYPQLVAGPIERPQHILPQFYEEKKVDYGRIQSGLRYILWGLFKKCVIADRLSLAVDSVYNNPYAPWSGLSVVLATILFALQIYGDFSGYSDIAVGTARVMGFNLMPNFRQPYFSQSVSEFWTRWHISLSTWFRDYVYIPLGGNRAGWLRTSVNLYIVFLLSGLWHGANWTFVVWGALHGSFLVMSWWIKNSGRRLPSIPPSVKTLLTFLCISLAWVYFRADSMATAHHLLERMFRFDKGYLTLAQAEANGLGMTYLGLPFWKFCLTVGTGFGFLYLDKALADGLKQRFLEMPTAIRWGGYYILMAAILLCGVFETHPFIYFQF